MRPPALPEVPEQAVALARTRSPESALAMRVRDEVGEVFALGRSLTFGVRGKPGISPGQVAMVTVLQSPSTSPTGRPCQRPQCGPVADSSESRGGLTVRVSWSSDL